MLQLPKVADQLESPSVETCPYFVLRDLLALAAHIKLLHSALTLRVCLMTTQLSHLELRTIIGIGSAHSFAPHSKSRTAELLDRVHAMMCMSITPAFRPNMDTPRISIWDLRTSLRRHR